MEQLQTTHGMRFHNSLDRSVSFSPLGFSSVCGCRGHQRDMGCHRGCWVLMGGWCVRGRIRLPCVFLRAWSFVVRSFVWRSQAWRRAVGRSKADMNLNVIQDKNMFSFLLYLCWSVRDRRWGNRWNTCAPEATSLQLYVFIGILLGWRIFRRKRTSMTTELQNNFAALHNLTRVYSFHIRLMCFDYSSSRCATTDNSVLSQLVFHYDKIHICQHGWCKNVTVATNPSPNFPVHPSFSYFCSINPSHTWGTGIRETFSSVNCCFGRKTNHFSHCWLRSDVNCICTCSKLCTGVYLSHQGIRATAGQCWKTLTGMWIV